MPLHRIVVLISVLILLPLQYAQAKGLLVGTQWVSQQLKKNTIILIDMSDAMQYARFHIPEAIHLPYEMLVFRDKNISHPIPQDKLIALLGKLGIAADSHIVIYDDTAGLNASRLYWELEQLGHRKVSLLDGGLVKWILEGRRVTNQAPTPHAGQTYVPSTSGRPAIATLADVHPASRDKQTQLLDVRSDEEYKGNPKEARSGHIPGAKWWEWDQAVDVDAGFMQHDEKTLLDSLNKLGIGDRKQPIIAYCRSGHRASQTYFTLKRLGFEQVRLYTGSMLEYAQDKALPLTTGMSP